MSLDPTTTAIVQLAWSRRFGLDDGALAGAGGRICCIAEDADEFCYVNLFGTEVLRGPAWAVDAGAGLDAEELSRRSTLLRLSHPHGGRALGESVLYYSDQLPEVRPRNDTAVSTEAGHARMLESACPPDDVEEVGLSGMQEHFILLDDVSGPAPRAVAGAGYDIWNGILAHLGVLTAPENRRRGLGAYAAAIAVEEALAAGLVPQLRVRTDNTAARSIASRLGFVAAGTQTGVILPK